MKKHHIDMLEAAKNLLANMSSDELLDEFLELQENSCGPTVQDFFQSLMLSTNELYSFVHLNDEKYIYADTYKLDLSEWSIPCILSHSTDFDIKSANDDKYHLHPQEMKKNNSFLDEDFDFALAS